jgi:hypothetical protein
MIDYGSSVRYWELYNKGVIGFDRLVFLGLLDRDKIVEYKICWVIDRDKIVEYKICWVLLDCVVLGVFW